MPIEVSMFCEWSFSEAATSHLLWKTAGLGEYPITFRRQSRVTGAADRINLFKQVAWLECQLILTP